jgi:serine/threonine protein kinase
MDKLLKLTKNAYKDKNPEILMGDYSIKHTIGKGTFGKVKIGFHMPTKENVAIKILEKKKITDRDDIIRIEREVKICKSLNHLNIIKIFEVKIMN